MPWTAKRSRVPDGGEGTLLYTQRGTNQRSGWGALHRPVLSRSIMRGWALRLLSRVASPWRPQGSQCSQRRSMARSNGCVGGERRALVSHYWSHDDAETTRGRSQEAIDWGGGGGRGTACTRPTLTPTPPEGHSLTRPAHALAATARDHPRRTHRRQRNCCNAMGAEECHPPQVKCSFWALLRPRTPSTALRSHAPP